MNFDFQYFDVLDSTNDRAKDLARQGADAGTVIVAEQQLKGRGRQGNDWVSPKGNVYMSVILREDVPMALAGQLSFLAAVVLADVVHPKLKDGYKLEQKWPNDVWINGQKLAGILLESEAQNTQSMDWIVLGMGVNLASAPEYAVCLNDVSDHTYIVQDFVPLYCESLKARLENWRAAGFEAIRHDWLKHARGLNTGITVRLPNRSYKGVFRGIDETGQLCLEHEGDIQKIASGDVFFE